MAAVERPSVLNGHVVSLKADFTFPASILQTSVARIHNDVYQREHYIRRVAVLTDNNTYNNNNNNNNNLFSLPQLG